MFFEELFFISIFFSFGLIIGYNLRNQRTIEQVDEQLRKDLAKHKNLNKSLQDDITFLREKINKLTNLK